MASNLNSYAKNRQSPDSLLGFLLGVGLLPGARLLLRAALFSGSALFGRRLLFCRRLFGRLLLRRPALFRRRLLDLRQLVDSEPLRRLALFQHTALQPLFDGGPQIRVEGGPRFLLVVLLDPARDGGSRRALPVLQRLNGLDHHVQIRRLRLSCCWGGHIVALIVGGSTIDLCVAAKEGCLVQTEK